MRKALWITFGVGVGIVATIVGIVVLAFYLTSDAVQAADELLNSIGEGRLEEAYRSTASGLRAAQDEAQFIHAVSFLGLTDYQSRTWMQRSVRGNAGKVEGAITTRQGVSLPLRVEVVYEDGKWKVFGLEGDANACKNYLLAHKAPSPAQTQELVRATLAKFNHSLKARDFTDFHAQLSGFWKREIQPNALLKSFQSFIDSRVDLSDIKDMPATITEASTIDNNFALVLSGSYEAPPNPVQFTLKYVLERDAWKLSGIHVNR